MMATYSRLVDCNVDLEDVYELGYARNDLWTWLSFDDIPLGEKYEKYKLRADKLNIDLADEPSEATNIDAKKKFIRGQIIKAEDNLSKRDDKRIQYVYLAASYVARFDIALLISKTKCDISQSWSDELPKIIDSIKQMAANLKVNIDEELDTMKNCEEFVANSTIRHTQQLKIKEKLCERAENKEPKRSEVDPSRIITDENWVVSLLRLPDRRNNEHAFLVLEGKTGNTSMIWFIDFVANDTFDLLLAGIRNGKVRKDYHESQGEVDSSEKLLFQCRRKMMDIREGDRFLSSEWAIPKPTAEILIKNIEAKQNNPPKYNILGDSALAGSTAAIKSTEIGHNCYTFARMMLRDLKNQYIQLPQECLGDWIFSATSRVLVDTRIQRREASRYTLMLVLLVGVVAGVVISYVLQKLM